MARTSARLWLWIGLIVCLARPDDAVAQLEHDEVPSAAGDCVSPDGGYSYCCDMDGDYVTSTCADGYSYYLLEYACTEIGSLCDEDGLTCTTLLGERDGMPTRGCYSDPDCDDFNVNRYPPVPPVQGSLEFCDGLDNDCDTSIDETFDQDGDYVTEDCGMFAWYVGPPVPDSTTGPGCDTTTGDVASQQGCSSEPDCNDLNPAVYPPNPGDTDGATEVCDPDDVDENCNGLADDLDPNLDPSSQPVWYPDVDRDGWGDPGGTPVQSCDMPGGPIDYAPQAGDCDDRDPEMYPGATEVCNGQDDDCDTQIDEDSDLDGDGTKSCGDDGQDGTPDDDCNDLNARIYPGNDESCDALDNDCNGIVDESFDEDGDSYSLCGTDGIEGTPDDDCDNGDPAVYPGAPERCNGIDDDCDGSPDDASPDTQLWWRDQDGDGYGDPSASEQSCQQPDNYVPAAEPYPPADCNDQDPSVYPGAANERLDGSDTNCDGQVPLIELDCDGDGQFPISRRLLAAWQSGLIPDGQVYQSCTDKTFLYNVELGAPGTQGFPNDSIVTADSLGLEPCLQGDIPPRVSCLGFLSPGDFAVVCDLAANLWVVDNYTEVKVIFDARRSTLEVARCDADFADCNDQRGGVCGCSSELCDGVDTNCAEDGNNAVDLERLDANLPDGVPDAMQSEAPKEGALSLREIDMDADGALFCSQGEPLDGFNDDLYLWSSAGQPSQWAYLDCEDQCAVKAPGAIERCDGIPNNACLFETTGQAQDPGHETTGSAAACGFMSSSSSLNTDAIYVLVYDACPECAGSSKLRYVPLTDIRSTLPYPDEFLTSEGDCKADDANCLINDPAYTLLDAQIVKVMGEYTSPDHSNSCLPDGLARVHFSEDPALELLRLCLPSGSADTQSSSRCRLMRIELTDKGNDTIASLYDELISQPSTLCSSAYSTRVLWPADRVRSARDVVSLWHCIQTGQCVCLEDDSSTGPVTRSCPQITQAPVREWARVPYPRSNDLITVDSVTSLPVDLGPFLDPEFVGLAGWLSSCWQTYNLVGGGCGEGNRDTVEGPRDIYGRLTGSDPECTACIDGFDNNCNGLIDEEDPGCYPCFQGQGISCGCSEESGAVPAIGGSLAALIPVALQLWRRRRTGGAA